MRIKQRSYVGLLLWVEQWTGQQTVLQHPQDLHVQLSEKSSVGHKSRTVPVLLLLLRLLLQQRPSLTSGVWSPKANMSVAHLPAGFCLQWWCLPAERCFLMNSDRGPFASSQRLLKQTKPWVSCPATVLWCQTHNITFLSLIHRCSRTG